MKIFNVYWYHLSTHTDPYLEGYVGVTSQIAIRHRCHKHGRWGGSKVLHKAFIKYGEENIICDVLHIVNTKEQAYKIESKYRPRESTGWNIAIGGGLPPDTTGRIDSQATKDRRNASVRAAKESGIYPSIFKGVTDRHSEARKKEIGEFHRGKKLSDAHKKAFLASVTGELNANAQEVYLVNLAFPEVVHYFKTIKMAADTLGLPYQALRSLVQRTVKTGKRSEPSRKGWICLTPVDANLPSIAVASCIEDRKERFRLGIAKREQLRAERKGTGLTPSINI